DIKAANVLLEPGGRVVLMDLGIARLLSGAQVTQQGLMLGTPEAIAPEQITGRRIGPAADIYLLGVLAYHLVAGRPPFTGDTPRPAPNSRSGSTGATPINDAGTTLPAASSPAGKRRRSGSAPTPVSAASADRGRTAVAPPAAMPLPVRPIARPRRTGRFVALA